MGAVGTKLGDIGKAVVAIWLCVALAPPGSAAENSPSRGDYKASTGVEDTRTATSRSGLTYTELREMGEGAVVFGCDGNCERPELSALACEASAPLLCIRDVAAPGPLGMASDVWSAGLLARTLPLKGTSMGSQLEADSACRIAFGTDWRMASVEDGNRGRIGGYALDGIAMQGGPVWVASRTQPETTCW